MNNKRVGFYTQWLEPVPIGRNGELVPESQWRRRRLTI